MDVPLERAGHVEVRLASTLRAPSRRAPLDRLPRLGVVVRAAVQGLVIGASIGVLAATGWASPASTFAIGAAAVLYAFLSFAGEAPPRS
jgi:hypothetical protein